MTFSPVATVALTSPAISGLAPDIDTLTTLFTICRPAWSKTENNFVNGFLVPLGEKDQQGNVWVSVPNPDGSPAPVLWSCHTDTVHKAGGSQRIVNDQGTFRLAKGSRSSCLGADDSAGIWLALEMIRARRPGLYIFHRAEEIGGIGSQWIADNRAADLAHIRFAIAFDRFGTSDVITHQMGQRCASDAFAKSLGAMLPGKYSPSPKGSFTDTANYMDFIPECSNISVGYERQHFSNESQDVQHLLNLREALLELDAANLVESRDPKENMYSSDFGAYMRNRRQEDDIHDLVYNNPDAIAEWFIRDGVSRKDILDAIDEYESTRRGR